MANVFPSPTFCWCAVACASHFSRFQQLAAKFSIAPKCQEEAAAMVIRSKPKKGPTMTKTFSKLALAAAIVLCPATSAQAGESWMTVMAASPGKPVSARVELADLDLRQSGDQSELRQRVRVAARTICNVAASKDREFSEVLPPFLQCRRAATHSAMRQVRQMIARAGEGRSLAAMVLSVEKTR